MLDKLIINTKKSIMASVMSYEQEVQIRKF